MGDSIRLLQLEAVVGRDTMAVGVEYQGGAVEGLGNTMVIGVVKLMGVQRGYVGLVLGRT